MPRQSRIRLFAGAAAALALLVGAGQPALAKQTAPNVQASTFSGAFLAARAAETDNDLDAAIAYYERALVFSPDNQSLQQSLMLALISVGRFDEALPYADKLKAVPEVERFSRLALAIDALRTDKYAEAENWLKLALESELDRLISRVMTAWAKAGSGNYDDAIAVLDGLEGPDWYAVFTGYHRALIAERAGDAKAAEAAFAALMDNVGAGGTAPETYLRGAEAYAAFLSRAGEKERALAVIGRAEAFSSGRIPIAALRSRIEKGEKVPRAVATPRDGAAELLLNLGAALNRGGGEPFVKLYLQYALALKPDSDSALLQLAAVAEQQQDAETAIAYYRRLAADSPLKRVAEMQLGLNLADLKRHDEAIVHLKKLLEQQPDDMRAYLALGGVHASREDYKSAAAVYEQAVSRLPNPDKSNWNIFYQRGIAYERLKEWSKAEPSFRKALELFPDQPQVLNYLGYSWVDMNMNLEEGLELIRKAVDLRPSDGYIVDSLGWAYYKLERFDDAVRELERAVSLKPDDPVLNDHLGDAYWRVGRRLEATFQWSHARDMKPEADVLAEVQKKLADGLPPLKPRAAAEAPEAVPEAAPAAVPDADKRTELHEPQDTMAATPAAYVVKPGQSLWSIADDVLGSGKRYREILLLNPDLQGDPGRLFPGQHLILP